MNDKLYVSIKYRTRWKSDEILLGLNSVKLSSHHQGMVSVDLSQLPNLPDLRVIDLSCNRLESIDITPLSQCQHLGVLNLSQNQLSEINLAPLSGCRFLEYLDLKDNKLTSLNLLPLTYCTNLRELNVQGNLLKYLAFGPLILNTISDKFCIVQNAKFDSELDSELNRKILSDRLLAYIIQNAQMPWLNQFGRWPKIDWHSYSHLVCKHGWNKVRAHMLTMVDLLTDDIWFDGQYELFRTFGFPELAGFDGDLSSLISKIPVSLDYKAVRKKFHDFIIDSLITQFNQNGCTHFFDTNAMSTTKASILIPELLARRMKEMEGITLQIKKNNINLHPLWLTSYGFKILSTLGMSTSTNMKGFQKVRKSLKRLGFSINLERNIEDTTSVGDMNMSHRMMRFILRLASQRGKGGLAPPTSS
jgi:hypothetical protein